MVGVVVHGDAELFCDGAHGLEDCVSEELFAHVVPDIFGRVELWGIRRQCFQHHVVGDVQSTGAVARCAVIDHKNEVVREFFAHMTQEEAHALPVHGGQNEVA